MSENWVRQTVTAELLSDAHLGSGSGGGGIDALVARDRYDRPVIWASHVEGVLRDAARRLRGDDEAGEFFGRAGGERQRSVFTSLYTSSNAESRIWRSSARKAYDNRAPKDDTLRAIEYVPKGTKFVGEVELPARKLDTLKRLVQEVDALGGGRSTGAGRVKLTLSDAPSMPRKIGTPPTERLVLLLKNRDPLSITATATPDNLIPSLAFVPGRALLGAVAAWLIDGDDCATASLLTSGVVSVSDALPLPCAPHNVNDVEVLPAPLTLQREKPEGVAGDVPWWAQATAPAKRLDVWTRLGDGEHKLKRPEDDLFVAREAANGEWTSFRPERRVRLRNGRPDPKQPDASLFAIEQIVEDTYFLAELCGPVEALKDLAAKLSPVLEGCRWLRLGRAGAPVEVAQVAWSAARVEAKTGNEGLLTLTSDLLVRDEYLRWRTELDVEALREVVGDQDIVIETTNRGKLGALQDSVMVHGFNGTSRLWRMPAAAIRRGSVFKVSGAGVATLKERAARREWLGERTHEGFGRFRIDDVLPGVTRDSRSHIHWTTQQDVDEESIAKETQEWFKAHSSLAEVGGGGDRRPSLSQWFDLVGELERGETDAPRSRIEPSTAGGKSWKHARAILDKLNEISEDRRADYARFFIRWLRAGMRTKAREAS